MIPKTIWQTYKDPFDKLPEYAKKSIQSWIDLNPEYEYKYMDDLQARSFILSEYDKEWVDIWDSYPLGVMRGDLWRYLIINKFGGVYADIDTICNKPIRTWLKKEYDMIICDDGDFVNYAQLAFAAKKNHPILNKVLDLVKKVSLNANYSDPNFVHNITGVHIWTHAINIAMMESKQNIYIYKNKDANLFHDDAITHLVGSKNWNTEGYVQWQEEIKKYDYTNYRITR